MEADELVEGKVVVECVDNPIAELPCVGASLVVLEAIGFGEAGDIKPVLCPALAVCGGLKEAIDDFFVGFWRGVGEEGFLLCGGWWKACEVEGNTAEEGEFVGGPGGREIGVFKAGEDEAVDGVFGPVVHSYGGRFGVGDGEERPVSAFLIADGGLGVGGGKFAWCWFGGEGWLGY